MAAMALEETGQTRFCEACRWDAGAGEFIRLGRRMPGALPEPNDRSSVSARAGGVLRIERRKIVFTSSLASVCGGRDRPLRKKIIGHEMSIFPCGLTGGNVFRRLLRAFPLFHQPASEHSGGVFLHPQIEKRANLFAEISGMAETREFITLQRVTRSGEKKLPRGLGFVVVHGASR
jgi:hypothetical protein